MSVYDRAILPGTRPKAKPPIPIGSRVLLASCPHGEPGRVTGVQGGKISVRWSDLDYTGKHRPEALVLADTESSATTKEPT